MPQLKFTWAVLLNPHIMPKINSGILGPYSGSIGSVTGYRRNGKNIIQSKRNSPTGPLNEVGQLQAEFMKLASLRYARYERLIWRILPLLPHGSWIKWPDFLKTGLNNSLLASPTQWQRIELKTNNNFFKSVVFQTLNPISGNAVVQISNLAQLRVKYPDLQRANILSRNPNDAWFVTWANVNSNTVQIQHVMSGTGTYSGTLAGTCLRSLSAGVYSPLYITIKSQV